MTTIISYGTHQAAHLWILDILKKAKAKYTTDPTCVTLNPSCVYTTVTLTLTLILTLNPNLKAKPLP